jgi:hypothetical protein
VPVILTKLLKAIAPLPVAAAAAQCYNNDNKKESNWRTNDGKRLTNRPKRLLHNCSNKEINPGIKNQ